MTPVSFIISTSGTNDDSINLTIDSIEANNIPEYEVIIVGGLECGVKRKNTIHIPFDEHLTNRPWVTRKKNTGVYSSKYDICVVMHDYYLLDANWYTEFDKFGTDWDICVHKNLAITHGQSVYQEGNGWRLGFNQIPGYPEIPMLSLIPEDIDCFIPYMSFDGAYWVCKKHIMLKTPMNENMTLEEAEDVEWFSRITPGWQGQKPNQTGYRIVNNPKCITMCSRERYGYPGNPDFVQIKESLNWLWDMIRNGYRRPNIYHYNSKSHQIILT
jgi:hypothetical protein